MQTIWKTTTGEHLLLDKEDNTYVLCDDTGLRCVRVRVINSQQFEVDDEVYTIVKGSLRSVD